MNYAVGREYLDDQMVAFLIEKGLPANKMKYVGSGAYADTWELPSPWRAVVRISNMHSYKSGGYFRAKALQKLQREHQTKHLPTIYNVWKYQGDYDYCIILMEKYFRVERYHSDTMNDNSGRRYSDIERDFFHKAYTQATREAQLIDSDVSDSHGYNVGTDYSGNFVQFDIW